MAYQNLKGVGKQAAKKRAFGKNLGPREKPIPKRPMHPKGEKSLMAVFKDMERKRLNPNKTPVPELKPISPYEPPPSKPQPVDLGKSSKYGQATLKGRRSTNVEDKRVNEKQVATQTLKGRG